MKYKIGDKVKFLNEVGGGIIQKIISPTMVSVANQDGFDLPVLISEIIFAESDNPTEKVFNQNFELSADQQPKVAENEEGSRSIKLQRFSSLHKNAFGIYLGYIPHDQVWLLKDAVDLYLFNYTDFEVVYNLTMEEENGTFSGIDYGSIDPFSKVHITTIERNELEMNLKGYAQTLFFKEIGSQIRLPLHAPFQVKMQRFLEKESYTPTNFSAERGIFIYLGKSFSPDTAQQDLLKKDSQLLEKQQVKIAQIVSEDSFIAPYKTDRFTAEVDLHIESIVNDHSKMDKGEILETQKNLFLRCLESGMAEKLQKIIFIHGVGNGSLKNEIAQTLKQYPNIHYFDASMRKYGCGATEVLIK
ncbi:MAG: Smr/MutS family protein [Lentimicrobiaceae bacterium]|nr:Smr/MutS family protein [Lentimicrobiaceae bacterium]